MSQFERKDTVIESTSGLPRTPNDASKGHLGVLDADSALTLNKKKSWFGGLRDVVQKSALQAKATIDSFRATPNKHEENLASVGEEAEPASQPDRVEDRDTTKSNDERPHSLTPKSGKVSIRRRAPHHSTRQYKQRNSVFSTSSRASSEISQVFGPEGVESSLQGDGNNEAHKRKPSVATSLVGSIRGLGRKKNMDNHALPDGLAALEKAAERVPLPSSPIDIPSAAPALDLDLGPAGILSDWSPVSERVQEALKQTDIPTGRPGIPAPIHARHGHGFPQPARPTTPANLRCLQIESNNDGVIQRPPGPSTPMPGTNMPMELDGADSDKSVRSQVFERSVTSTTFKERKQLRSMRSLDAMAEACAVAHAHDDEMMLVDAVSPNTTCGSDFHSLSASDTPPKDSEILGDLPARRNLTSTSTLPTCPSDMEELSRVHARGSYTDDAAAPSDPGAIDEPVLVLKTHDLGVGLGVGPPSPDRSLKLPYRPKVETNMGDSTSQDTPVSPISVDWDAVLFKPRVESSEETPITPEQSLELQLELQRRNELLPMLHSNTQDRTLESENTIFDDDPSLRNQQLFVSNVMLPDYEGHNSPPSNGTPPHGVHVMLQPDPDSLPPAINSPTKIPAHAAVTADISDADHTFHFDNWINSTPPTYASPSKPHTPRQRSIDATIDDFSPLGNERQTPQISPRSSNAERTPMRATTSSSYDAAPESGVPERRYSSAQMALAFILNDSQDLDATALASVDIDTAYASSPTTSPGGENKALWKPRHDSAQPRASDEEEPAFWEYKFQPQLSPTPEMGPQQHETSLLENNDARSSSTAVIANPGNFPPKHLTFYPDPDPSTRPSTNLTVMDPLGPPPSRRRGQLSELSESSVNPPRPPIGSRVTSTDTLDYSLDLYDSPSKEKPIHAKSPTTKSPLALRYRNVANRSRMTPSIDEVARHGV